jgi:hypothetical protein
VPAPVNRHQSRRALAVKLGAVVAANEPRSCPALDDQAVQHGHGGVSVNPAVDLDRQGLAGVLVHDVEQLQPPAVLGLVELVVQRPHMVGMLGRQPVRRRARGPEPLPLATPSGDAQAFVAPQPLHGLAVDRPAALAELGVRAAVAPPRMDPAERAELLTERSIPVGLHRLMALGAAVLADQPARPPLRDAQHALQVRCGAPAACWAHQFPRPSSFKASIRNSLSATIRLSRAFSVSSSLSRRASSALSPPYCARQRW